MDSTVPALPCRSVEESLAFYELLGFERTYEQKRPYPYAVITRGGIAIHLFEIAGLVPEDSYTTILIVTPDPRVLFDAFASGLRAGMGRLPVDGIPRITRPRAKQGTSGGFSVIDPGGNWLRVVRAGESEQHKTEPGLPRIVENAARQGDSRGEDEAAIAILDAGLARYPEASPAERLAALVYLAELLVRIGDADRARATLDRVAALGLSDTDEEAAADLAAAKDLRAALPD